MAEELTGTIRGRREFEAGETIISGTLYGPVRVGQDARVTVDGTIYGPMHVRGRLVVKGTVYRQLIVEEGADCLLEGALYGDVLNRGTLRADVDVLDGGIRNEGPGQHLPHRGRFRRERRPDGTLVHTWHD